MCLKILFTKKKRRRKNWYTYIKKQKTSAYAKCFIYRVIKGSMYMAHIKGDLSDIYFSLSFSVLYRFFCMWKSLKGKKFKLGGNRSSSSPQKTLLLKSLEFSTMCDITLHHHAIHLSFLYVDWAQLHCYCQWCWVRRVQADQSEQTESR